MVFCFGVVALFNAPIIFSQNDGHTFTGLLSIAHLYLISFLCFSQSFLLISFNLLLLLPIHLMYLLYFERIALKSFLNLTFRPSDISFCWMFICSSIGHILLFPCLSVIWVMNMVSRKPQDPPRVTWQLCSREPTLSANRQLCPARQQQIHPSSPSFPFLQPLFLSLESWVSFVDDTAEHLAKGLSRVCPLTFQIHPDLVLCLLSQVGLRSTRSQKSSRQTLFPLCHLVFHRKMSSVFCQLVPLHTSYLCSCEDYTQTVGATHSVAYLFLGSYPILLCHIKKEKKN